MGRNSKNSKKDTVESPILPSSFFLFLKNYPFLQEEIPKIYKGIFSGSPRENPTRKETPFPSSSENPRPSLSYEQVRKIGRYLYYFPFVYGVALCGSQAHRWENGKDLDLFLIIQKNRLYLARLLLRLFTLIYNRFFSPPLDLSYLREEGDLQLEEKTYYHAWEIGSCMPLAGEKWEEFFQENNWVEEFSPLLPRHPLPTPQKVKKPFLSRLLQGIFSSFPGDLLNFLLYHLYRFYLFFRNPYYRNHRKEEKRFLSLHRLTTPGYGYYPLIRSSFQRNLSSLPLSPTEQQFLTETLFPLLPFETLWDPSIQERFYKNYPS